MVFKRFAAALLGGGFMLALVTGGAGVALAQSKGQPGVFDYYVLTLSWSPAFCASKGANAPVEQCGGDKNYGFVVHGLWPQYEKSGYPESCAISPDVPANVVTQTYPIMPSKGLMNHEWKKHGTCSGLSVQEYFADLRASYQRLNLANVLQAPPPGFQVPLGGLVTAIINDSQSVPADGVVTTCNAKGQVAEVMLCFSRDLVPRACGPSVKSNCPAGAMLER